MENIIEYFSNFFKDPSYNFLSFFILIKYIFKIKIIIFIKMSKKMEERTRYKR